jgi:hypothetical protein
VSFLRRNLRRFGGFATLAMLAFALLPAVSQALMGAAGGQPWTEVCSVAGKKLLALATPSNPASPAAAWQMDHCALCGAGTGALGLPAVADSPGLLKAGADVMPAREARAPALPLAWAPALPRAPPRRA